MELRSLVVLAAACSSGKPKVIEDARSARRAEAVPAAPNAKGDVAVRVEWHDVPVASRESPGRNACGTARRAAVAPTTTWGIPDVIVMLQVDRAMSPSGRAMPPSGRVVVEPCELVPRVIVAGDSLSITSAIDAPAQLAITKQGDVAALATLTSGTSRPIELPIAGHEVIAALDPGAVYSLALDSEIAWIVTDRHATAITDATGQATFRDIAVGTYPVTAWLPPHGSDHARLAHGQVTIAAGALAELTLDVTEPAAP